MLALLCCLSVLFKCKRSLLVDPIGELQFGNEKIKSLIFWIACVVTPSPCHRYVMIQNKMEFSLFYATTLFLYSRKISENQGLERVKWHEIGKMQLLTHKLL